MLLLVAGLELVHYVSYVSALPLLLHQLLMQVLQEETINSRCAVCVYVHIEYTRRLGRKRVGGSGLTARAVSSQGVEVTQVGTRHSD